ncbi:Putative six-hairpin glycosidase superfamily, glycosyl hydrolase, family 88 [Septoria linicola]|uniref:Six-hairpin glycosidase superfamily, glycosyl hydrolase, family 88 n=1 Tax=Septoria linicola TaxID=215465 RepID=A0A9Q9EIS9_9PEZI|nr:putative six-hairpin glycosidase superfamily, glycosyl hydrolase, family 88 [Septoria linicola]USW51377.1 Putative six-hairpin glycosidase superfamily, glycosyl hydrolase, family 88 [Septoria linicola]
MAEIRQRKPIVPDTQAQGPDVRPQTWADPGTWSKQTKWLPAYIAVAAVAIALLILRFVHKPGLDTTNYENCVATFNFSFPINAALAQAQEHSKHSWEIGYAHEATMQIFDPDRSVFGREPFPGGKLPTLGLRLDEASIYAQKKIKVLDTSLFDEDDGAVSDPAALGVAALMLGQRSWNSKDYRVAADRQKDLLLKTAPRYANGAISHRMENAELWSDAIAMFPPFLAYSGVAGNDTALVHEAITQIGLYRSVLRGKVGLWKHIVGSADRDDPGFWSTGNAWAAYGMARVRATITTWRADDAVLAQDRQDLDSWIQDILDAVIATDNDDSGLLRNYLGDNEYAGETSGTSLLAATVYRMALLNSEIFGQRKYLDWVDAKRRAVVSRVDGDGFARPAANPLDHKSKEPVEMGAEGESFLLLLGTAWRDCVCDGLCLDTYAAEHGMQSKPEPLDDDAPWYSWRNELSAWYKYFQAP